MIGYDLLDEKAAEGERICIARRKIQKRERKLQLAMRRKLFYASVLQTWFSL
jgi:hypothetical protein